MSASGRLLTVTRTGSASLDFKQKKKGEKSKNLSDGNLIETQEALGTAGNVCIRPGGKFTRRFSSPTDGKIDHTAAKTTTTNRAQQIRM